MQFAKSLQALFFVALFFPCRLLNKKTQKTNLKSQPLRLKILEQRRVALNVPNKLLNNDLLSLLSSLFQVCFRGETGPQSRLFHTKEYSMLPKAEHTSLDYEKLRAQLKVLQAGHYLLAIYVMQQMKKKFLTLLENVKYARYNFPILNCIVKLRC